MGKSHWVIEVGAGLGDWAAASSENMVVAIAPKHGLIPAGRSLRSPDGSCSVDSAARTDRRQRTVRRALTQNHTLAEAWV
jgi:hypothetical protein